MPPVELAQTELQFLAESWRKGEIEIAEAMALHVSVVPGADERADYDRFGVELSRQLALIMSELRTKTNALLASLLDERRFDEARVALVDGFDAELMSASGFTMTALPLARRSATKSWRESGLAGIEGALAEVYYESGAELRRWCDLEIWPVVREQTSAREFASASAVLEADLSSYLEGAGVRLDGLELKRLRESAGWSLAEETRQRLSYKLDKAWRELDEDLLSDVQDEWEDASESLEQGTSLAVSGEFAAWARGHFLSEGLDLDAIPGEFVSKAVNTFEARMEGLVEREIELSMKREFETLERLDAGSQTFLLERRYAELLAWWGAEREVADESVKSFIELRMEETRLLAELLEDAHAAVVAGVDGEVWLIEGGSKILSAVRLDGHHAAAAALPCELTHPTRDTDAERAAAVGRHDRVDVATGLDQRRPRPFWVPNLRSVRAPEGRSVRSVSRGWN